MQGKMESEMMPSSFKNFRGHDIVPRNERIESQLAVVLRIITCCPARRSGKELELPAVLSARREILGADALGERLADPGVRGRHRMAVIEVNRLTAM